MAAEKFRHQGTEILPWESARLRKMPSPKILAQKNPTPKYPKKVRFVKVPDIRQLTAAKKNYE